MGDFLSLIFLLVLVLVLVLYWLCAPIYLLIRQKRAERELAEISQKLKTALGELAQLQLFKQQQKASGSKQDTAEIEPTELKVEATELEEPKETVEPLDGATDIASEKAAEVDEFALEATGTPGLAQTSKPVDETQAPPERTVEETLTSKWLIWVGAVAVALSAIFLFRYAVDQGWLTPITRVILGLVLGGCLLSAGEWAMRHPVEAMRRAMNPDYVPPALTGSGIFAIFVSLYAAHAIFELLSVTTGFVALALVSYSALGLSLRQGPFVAILGLLAGYLVPAFIVSPTPLAAPLFLYLFVLSAACLLVMVWRKWWWFSYLTLAGAIIWPTIWLITNWTLADQGVLCSYALGLAILFAVLSTSLPIKQPDKPIWRWMAEMLTDTSGVGFVLSGLLLLALMNAADFNSSAFIFVSLYGAAALLVAVRRASLESLVIVAAAIALICVLIWPEPARVTPLSAAQHLPGPGFGPLLVPPEYRIFTNALWAYAALFGVGAFAGLRWGRTPAVWAGVSVIMPLLLFVVGYWRIGALETSSSWSAVAIGIAFLASLAAPMAARMREEGQNDLALAFYVAGATAALAFAFTCILREGWLTVALSCEIAALAWIWSRVQVRELRAIAAVVAGVVIIRLAGNPYVLDYEGTVLGVFGWVTYGYGIPALACFFAARIFASEPTDVVTTLCEIASVGFGFMMVALQLKLWTSGDLYAVGWRLFDQSIQSLWWIITAGLLLYEANRGKRVWPYPAGLGLLIISLVAVFLLHALVLSPLITDEALGSLPFINLLNLAYLLPAILFSLIASVRRFKLQDSARGLLQIASGILVFIYITLETRRAFWGSTIGLSFESQPTNGELYAYSAVWIVFSLCLLAVGILRVSVSLRYASLAFLMVAVVKVFLFDMSDLTGLYRVASFLGLGLTLIGIARIYQRFVFRPASSKEASEIT